MCVYASTPVFFRKPRFFRFARAEISMRARAHIYNLNMSYTQTTQVSHCFHFVIINLQLLHPYFLIFEIVLSNLSYFLVMEGMQKFGSD